MVRRHIPADLSHRIIAYGKRLIVSEPGGGAKPGLRGNENARCADDIRPILIAVRYRCSIEFPKLTGIVPRVLIDLHPPSRALGDIQQWLHPEEAYLRAGTEVACLLPVTKGL